MSYLPSFQNTQAIVNLVAEIVELAGAFDVNPGLVPNPTIRKINQLRTVHSSTWIEGNTLSLDEVTAVIDGKRVVAPEREILEVRQAFAAYAALDGMDPCSLDDLLKAHGIMMQGIAKDAGKLREVEVGVYSGGRLLHAGTPSSELPQAMDELFAWIESSHDHPLVQGCFFHCAFEGIHPFSDGNGRTGRLWHSLINRRWKSQLAWTPVETMVAANQQEYYSVLQASNAGEAAPFIEFMLEMVRDALMDAIMRADGFADDALFSSGSDFSSNPPSTPQVPPKLDNLVQQLLGILGDDELSASELMAALGLSDRKHFRESYLNPALDAGIIEPTIPDKPRSPKQKYRQVR